MTLHLFIRISAIQLASYYLFGNKQKTMNTKSRNQETITIVITYQW